MKLRDFVIIKYNAIKNQPGLKTKNWTIISDKGEFRLYPVNTLFPDEFTPIGNLKKLYKNL